MGYDNETPKPPDEPCLWPFMNWLRTACGTEWKLVPATVKCKTFTKVEVARAAVKCDTKALDDGPVHGGTLTPLMHVVCLRSKCFEPRC